MLFPEYRYIMNKLIMHFGNHFCYGHEALFLNVFFMCYGMQRGTKFQNLIEHAINISFEKYLF